jgi:hypothetical protein
MTRFPSGESFGDGEPEPGPLGLGFLVSGVGDGVSLWVLGVLDRLLIVKSAVRQASLKLVYLLIR